MKRLLPLAVLTLLGAAVAAQEPAGRPTPPSISVSGEATVTREGDKLMIHQGSSNEKRELLPENEANFFTNENRLQTFSFVKDEKGQVTHLALQTAGREVARAKKIK
jgi:hypothetical protein